MYIDMDEYKAEIKKWNAEHIQQIPEQTVERLMMNCRPFIIDGSTCDGYHTFNELYAHRTALFAALANQYPALVWKSKLHSDGSMYENMFVVGMNTPVGDISYHIDIKDWDLFQCKELNRAPEWDGYTSKDVVDRLKSLRNSDLNAFELRIMYERATQRAAERRWLKDEIVLTLCNQYERKNHDYGNSADDTYTRFGIVSYLTRISDKLNRFQTLSQTDAQIGDEKINDTVGDMYTYCCMALSKLSESDASVTDIMKNFGYKASMLPADEVIERFSSITAADIASVDDTKIKNVIEEMAIFSINELTNIEFERKIDNEEV